MEIVLMGGPALEEQGGDQEQNSFLHREQLDRVGLQREGHQSLLLESQRVELFVSLCLYLVEALLQNARNLNEVVFRIVENLLKRLNPHLNHFPLHILRVHHPPHFAAAHLLQHHTPVVPLHQSQSLLHSLLTIYRLSPLLLLFHFLKLVSPEFKLSYSYLSISIQHPHLFITIQTLLLLFTIIFYIFQLPLFTTSITIYFMLNTSIEIQYYII